MTATHASEKMEAPEDHSVNYVKIAPRPTLDAPSFQVHVQSEALRLETLYRQSQPEFILFNPQKLPAGLPCDANVDDISTTYTASNPQPARRIQLLLLNLACRYSDAFLGSLFCRSSGTGKSRFQVMRYVEEACRVYVANFGGEVEEVRKRIVDMRRGWMEMQLKAFKKRGSLLVWRRHAVEMDEDENIEVASGRSQVVAETPDDHLETDDGPDLHPLDAGDTSTDLPLTFPAWLPLSIRSRFFSPAALEQLLSPDADITIAQRGEVKLALFHHVMLALWQLTLREQHKDIAVSLVECLTNGYGIGSAAREHAVHTDIEPLIRGLVLAPRMDAAAAVKVVDRVSSLFPVMASKLQGTVWNSIGRLRDCLENRANLVIESVDTPQDDAVLHVPAAERENVVAAQRRVAAKDDTPAAADSTIINTEYEANAFLNAPTAPKSMRAQAKRPRELNHVAGTQHESKRPRPRHSQSSNRPSSDETFFTYQDLATLHPSRRSLLGGQDDLLSFPRRMEDKPVQSNTRGHRDQPVIHPERRNQVDGGMPALFRRRH